MPNFDSNSIENYEISPDSQVAANVEASLCLDLTAKLLKSTFVKWHVLTLSVKFCKFNDKFVATMCIVSSLNNIALWKFTCVIC